MDKVKKPKTTTIVLTWNSADFIEECLQSLLNSQYKTEILVIDNDSSDTTRDLIKQKFPAIKVLNTGANLGYAGGNNYGIDRLKTMATDLIFILNPDATIAKDCIGLLVKRMQTEQNLAAVSPMIYRQKSDVIWYAGSEINWKNGITPHRGYDEIDNGQYDGEAYTGRLNGCAMLLRSSLFQQVGLMDENYFLYYEESDWSVRFIEAGFSLGFVPAAKVWHLASASTGGHNSSTYEYYMTRNRLYFMSKNKTKVPRHFDKRILASIVFNLLVLLKKSGPRVFWQNTRYQLKGYVDYKRSRLGKQPI